MQTQVITTLAYTHQTTDMLRDSSYTSKKPRQTSGINSLLARYGESLVKPKKRKTNKQITQSKDLKTPAIPTDDDPVVIILKKGKHGGAKV